MFHENCKLSAQTDFYTNCPIYMKTVFILKPSIQYVHLLIVNDLLYAFNVLLLHWCTLQFICFARSKYFYSTCLILTQISQKCKRICLCF